MTIEAMNMKDWIMELCPEIAEWQAELIAEHADRLIASEREACAKVCEDTDIVEFQHCMVLHEDAAKTLRNAAAIRARGEK